MTTAIVDSKEKFTISLTKTELDSIQKQFLEEMEEMLNKVRSKDSRKSYCNAIVRDNVTVTLSLKNKNKINKINNNNNNNYLKNKVNVTVTISCLLLLHYLFITF